MAETRHENTASGRVEPCFDLDLTVVDREVASSPIEHLLSHRLVDMADIEPDQLWTAADFELVARHRLVMLCRPSWFEADVAPRVAQAQQEQQMWGLLLDASLDRLLAAYERGGVESRVLKGMATGRLDYPEPSLRQTADLDVLVRPDSLTDALAIAREVGFTHKNGVWADEDAALLKGVTLENEHGVQLDLHLRLSRQVQQSIDLLFDDAEPLPSGVGVAFGPNLRLVHAAQHLFHSPPTGHRRLSGFVDVLLLLQDPRIDEAAVRSVAEQLGALACIGGSLRAAGNLEGPLVDSSLRFEEATGLERRAFFGDRRSLASEHLLALSRTPGLTPKLRYLAGFLSPRQLEVRDESSMRAYLGRLIR